MIGIMKTLCIEVEDEMLDNLERVGPNQSQ